MNNKEIAQTWRKLLTPFAIGVIVLTTAILFHRLGSKRPGPQTLWFFSGVLGAIFVLMPGIKIIKFRQYLKNKRDTEKGDDEN